MRKLSLALVLLITLASVPASAGAVRAHRDDGRAYERVVRLIKSFFRLAINSDGLTPPLPPPAGQP